MNYSILHGVRFCVAYKISSAECASAYYGLDMRKLCKHEGLSDCTTKQSVKTCGSDVFIDSFQTIMFVFSEKGDLKVIKIIFTSQ